MAQMGFFDLSDRYASLDAKKDPLLEIDAVVPWEEFRPALERVWRKPDADRKSRAGRKPIDAVLMFKTLILSALYNLSDDQIEYQIRDRLSFMRFLGLGLGDRAPDAKTVWLYRDALAQAGKVEELFQLFDGHLNRQGYIARGGQILDASIVPVPRNHNTRDENKTIKNGEVLSLAACSDVEKDLRHRLMTSARRMAGVSPIRLSSDLFHRVQLSRNTSQYGLLMRVCELVFHALLPDEKGDGSKFQSILEDETRMSALFEDFLRNFFRSELPRYKAASEIMPWLAEADDEGDLAYLPIMKTDITLRSGARTIVADAKYYREVLAGGRYDPKVRSAHLYQLSTYLAHVRQREPGQDLSGLLIYPTGGQSLRLKYHLLGIPITVATVDLSAEWPEIHYELIELIEPSASPISDVVAQKA